MPRPVIAMLTDFGLHDHYVGAIKGVILGICGEAQMVDITHDIPPQDVLSGAMELDAASRYFPPETIFLAVVDPGVGSARRAIAVEAGGFRFVGPDNGLLSLAVGADPVHISAITDPRYALRSASRTFEGRDRFAPAAAWLASGVDIRALGAQLTDMVRLQLPQPARDGDSLRGEILRADRFGNLITSITVDALDRFLAGRAGRVDTGGLNPARLVATYADAHIGELCALIGSTGRLEVAVNAGNAADRIGAARGDAVFVRLLA
jgi:S-adenosylmethionine hydrolase